MNFTTTINVMTLSDINSKTSRISSMRDTECKQIASEKVIFYLKDREMSNPENLYSVMELETRHLTYINLTTCVIIIILLLSLTYWYNIHPV